ncbi:hypothetical protein D3C87_1521100 [compost metagenome]
MRVAGQLVQALLQLARIVAQHGVAPYFMALRKAVDGSRHGALVGSLRGACHAAFVAFKRQRHIVAVSAGGIDGGIEEQQRIVHRGKPANNRAGALLGNQRVGAGRGVPGRRVRG